MAAGRRVLIWGGAGFIGSHLCERLVSLGHEVVCADNLSTGSKQNISHLLDARHFTFAEDDVSTSHKLNEGFDLVFHLASPASMPAIRRDPLGCISANVDGARNILKAALDSNARVVLASTSEVYGDPEVSPQPETYRGSVNTVGPRSCYDEAKRLLETISYEYAELGVDVRLARIFNTYGPRLPKGDGRVVPRFFRSAFRGEPLTIYGDGNATRSFCYVSDQVSGLIALSEATTRGMLICNIGTEEEITVLDLAERILRITGSRSPICFETARTDDPSRRKPDLSRTREQLGWAPTVSLDEGLALASAFYRTADQ